MIRNNKNNNDHILTPTERVFYTHIAIEGTQRTIAECMTKYKENGNIDP
ncbi:MAG: hypothetical protein WCF23_23050 [Candidatus Nitrosopolaris sp.]